ncbi:MAG TPA: hypothetical protein VFY17_02865, partial [Pilimelia sp.]|nr:hypothetical protein [Pilimelia sp.]
PGMPARRHADPNSAPAPRPGAGRAMMLGYGLTRGALSSRPQAGQRRHRRGPALPVAPGNGATPPGRSGDSYAEGVW